MALLRVKDFIDIATKGFHNKTSWQVALDPGFTQIIDESLEDTVNVHEWHTKLPKIGTTNGECYADLDNLYARCKVWIDNTSSPWYVIQPKNQNQQQIIITELDGSVTYYDSIADHFN